MLRLRYLRVFLSDLCLDLQHFLIFLLLNFVNSTLPGLFLIIDSFAVFALLSGSFLLDPAQLLIMLLGFLS